MEIVGKLIQLMPNVEGDSARGHWVRGGFVIETQDDYPRKVAFTAFGEERIAMVQNVPMNSMVQVTFTPESREYNERWYTDLRASRVQPFVPGQMPQGPATGYAWTAQQPAQAMGGAPMQQPMQQAQPAQATMPPQSMPQGGFAAAPQPQQMPTSESDDLPF